MRKENYATTLHFKIENTRQSKQFLLNAKDSLIRQKVSITQFQTFLYLLNVLVLWNI